jgi:hypothetical protein
MFNRIVGHAIGKKYEKDGFGKLGNKLSVKNFQKFSYKNIIKEGNFTKKYFDKQVFDPLQHFNLKQFIIGGIGFVLGFIYSIALPVIAGMACSFGGPYLAFGCGIAVRGLLSAGASKFYGQGIYNLTKLSGGSNKEASKNRFIFENGYRAGSFGTSVIDEDYNFILEPIDVLISSILIFISDEIKRKLNL